MQTEDMPDTYNVSGRWGIRPGGAAGLMRRSAPCCSIDAETQQSHIRGSQVHDFLLPDSLQILLLWLISAIQR